MGWSSGRRVAALAILSASISLAACDNGGVGSPGVVETGTFTAATPPPANIAEELVRNTLSATGLQQPVQVLDIREGQLDDLRGLTPQAEAEASLDPRASGRRSLDRRAWRVTLIGSDPSNGCTGDPCVPSRVYVEAFLDPVSHSVIAVVVRAQP